jgi:hypothetical protein
MGLFGKSAQQQAWEAHLKRQEDNERYYSEINKAHAEETHHQLQTSRVQLERSEAHLRLADEHWRITNDHTARYEKLLAIWEEQARRFDAILTRWGSAPPR